MSIKKEMLGQLSEQQLRSLAESKGLKFQLNSVQKQYYTGWSDKDILVDLMTDQKRISVAEIEQFILEKKD